MGKGKAGLEVLIFFIIFAFKNLFIFGCTGSSLLCAGFLWLWRLGPLFIARHRRLTAVLLLWTRPLGTQASVVEARGL